MRLRTGTWMTLAAAVLAVAVLLALPWLAARVVRGELAAEGAADRAAYAQGSSPWQWRFRHADDVVAGRVFGPGTLDAVEGGLRLEAQVGAPLQVGFPLARPADLGSLDTLRLDMDAPASGRYALWLRQRLDGPLLRARIPPSPVIALGSLDWRDEDDRPVTPPSRAAMLRLEAEWASHDPLTLRGGALVATRPIDTSSLPIPEDATSEALLRWRDRQHAIRPVATFGNAASSNMPPAWLAWLPIIVYLAALAWAGTRWRRERPAQPHDAILAVLGPLGFIAGMQLSSHTPPSGIVLFAAGVIYALLLAWRRALPPWRLSGSWRMAGWPLLAVPVAIALVAVAGHAPSGVSVGRSLLYIGWALFQQWLLLAVFAAVLARVLPQAMAVVLTALAFALLHTPNGLLMQLCFVAELGWAWWYLQHRALLPVALAHAASAVVLQVGLAGGVLRSLEVSARYLMATR